MILSLIGTLVFILILDFIREASWFNFSSPLETSSKVKCSEEAKGLLGTGLELLQVSSQGATRILWSFDRNKASLRKSFMRLEGNSELKLYDQQSFQIFCEQQMRPPSCLQISAITQDPKSLQIKIQAFEDPYFVVKIEMGSLQMQALAKIEEGKHLSFKRRLGFCGKDLGDSSFSFFLPESLIFTNANGVIGAFDLDKSSLFHIAMSPGHPDSVRLIQPWGLDTIDCKKPLPKSWISATSSYSQRLLVEHGDAHNSSVLSMVENDRHGLRASKLADSNSMSLRPATWIDPHKFVLLKKDWLQSVAKLEIYETHGSPATSLVKKDEASFVVASHLFGYSNSNTTGILGIKVKPWFFSTGTSMIFVAPKNSEALTAPYPLSAGDDSSFKPFFWHSWDDHRFLNLYEVSGQAGWSVDSCLWGE